MGVTRTMSGKDAISGFYYQIAVGVLRLLEMLHETGPYKIVFEEIDADSEDIVCFYDNKIVYEQVKRRENRTWPPKPVQFVIKRFFEREIKSDVPVFFKFTTNSIPSPNTAESDILIRNIQDGFEEFSESDVLHKLIPDTIDTNRKKEIIQKLSIIWAFSYSPDPRNPVKAIRERCISKISSICQYNLKDAETLFGKLYELVSLYSSKRKNFVYRSDLRNFLPECFAKINEAVLSKIPEECKDLIEKQDFDYLECGRVIPEHGKFRIPLYAEKCDKRICFWFYGPQDDALLVRVIELATKNLEDFIHFIILIGEVTADVFPVRLRGYTIHCSDVRLLEME